MKIGFIGSGNMGGAIARGIVKSGVVSGKDVSSAGERHRRHGGQYA